MAICRYLIRRLQVAPCHVKLEHQECYGVGRRDASIGRTTAQVAAPCRRDASSFSKKRGRPMSLNVDPISAFTCLLRSFRRSQR